MGQGVHAEYAQPLPSSSLQRHLLADLRTPSLLPPCPRRHAPPGPARGRSYLVQTSKHCTQASPRCELPLHWYLHRRLNPPACNIGPNQPLPNAYELHLLHHQSEYEVMNKARTFDELQQIAHTLDKDNYATIQSYYRIADRIRTETIGNNMRARPNPFASTAPTGYPTLAPLLLLHSPPPPPLLIPS